MNILQKYSDPQMMNNPEAEPITLFGEWLREATKHEINDPTAVAVATVGTEGMPNVRMALLKEFDSRGFVFYTNLESAKGEEILATKRLAMCFHWKSLQRQVRLQGQAERICDEEADAYFHSRPRKSRIGAWASQQSRPLKNKQDLLKRIANYTLKFHAGPIERPPYWSGIRLVPSSIEFWQAGPFRLHDRVEFTRIDENSQWNKRFLQP